MFNRHVFVEEKKVYKTEGLPDDVMPIFKDNTPCCNLVERSQAHMIGIFGTLDDLTGKGDKVTDETFCKALCNRFGRNKGMEAVAPPFTSPSTPFVSFSYVSFPFLSFPFVVSIWFLFLSFPPSQDEGEGTKHVDSYF